MEAKSFVLKDARIVLRDSVLPRGWVAVEGGRIAEMGEGDGPFSGHSLGGDLLIPGLIELHTDHLEAHLKPRPSVDWHPLSAVLSYDAQIAASGITTVFDSMRLGTDERRMPTASAAIAIGRVIDGAQQAGLLRAEHRTHLRCEICSEDVVESLQACIAALPVHLVSLMDHTPGQRQFRDVEKLAIYFRTRVGMSEPEASAFIEERYVMSERYGAINRRALVDVARRHGIPLASHDDTTSEHVEESRGDGVLIAEFPTTAEAASASHAAGISVMMGAPNLVRGGSHSGNVSAIELARSGTLDILSSDYVPASLIQAALELPQLVPAISLPDAIATVTATPARAVGLDDRGVVEVGRRADLVQVKDAGEVPVVRRVWRAGARVA